MINPKNHAEAMAKLLQGKWLWKLYLAQSRVGIDPVLGAHGTALNEAWNNYWGSMLLS